MKKNGYIYTLLTGLAVMMMAGISQAAELNLDSRGVMSGELRDGTKLATGRIICREEHTGFHIWMNARQDEGRPGHYLIQGKQGSQHEIRARLEGEGWFVEQERQPGMVKSGTDDQAIFDVVADGIQQAVADEYVLTITGNCMGNRVRE
ncbi:AfaD family invasin [Klebsiella pneumoniae]